MFSRIAKKLNYKRPFLKIALPSMFFLADQMMDVYYHQMLISDVVALILFFSFCIIFLYGCFNTIQLRRMVSRFVLLIVFDVLKFSLRGGIHKRTQLDNLSKKVIQPPVFLLSSVPVVVQHKWDRHLMQSNTITLYKIIISFLGAVYDSRTAWPRIWPGSPRIWTGSDQGFGPVCRRIKKSHLLSSVI